MVLLAVLLSACAGDNMQDLRKFVSDVKARKPKPIDPLPQLKQIETFVYDSTGLRNPFSSSQVSSTPVVGVVGSGPRPDPNRRKEELESFALDSLRMVGTLDLQDNVWGLVLDREGTIHRVTAGNFMGEHDGQITRITENHIELTELVADGRGGYIERQASLALTTE
jgi:type IV pilus assembly protein PilP